MKVHATVLAAGEGRRMGGPKHLLEIDGVPMLLRVLRALAASRASSTRVVLRHPDAAGRALAGRAGVESLEVASPNEGRAASIRAGVRDAPPDAAFLFALADQPWLLGEDFDALITALSGGAGIVHARYAGERGTPVLFASGFRGELLELRGEQGGRQLIVRYPDRVASVDLPAERGRDVDRPEDLAPRSGPALEGC